MAAQSSIIVDGDSHLYRLLVEAGMNTDELRSRPSSDKRTFRQIAEEVYDETPIRKQNPHKYGFEHDVIAWGNYGFERVAWTLLLVSSLLLAALAALMPSCWDIFLTGSFGFGAIWVYASWTSYRDVWVRALWRYWFNNAAPEVEYQPITDERVLEWVSSTLEREETSLLQTDLKQRGDALNATIQEVADRLAALDAFADDQELWQMYGESIGAIREQLQERKDSLVRSKARLEEHRTQVITQINATLREVLPRFQREARLRRELEAATSLLETADLEVDMTHRLISTSTERLVRLLSAIHSSFERARYVNQTLTELEAGDAASRPAIDLDALIDLGPAEVEEALVDVRSPQLVKA